jgi:hypothetical protein
MQLQNQIEAINNPQEFTRLYNFVLDMEYGLDYIPIDDDQADAGNDGYLKSEKRIFAGHCFKRIQKQKLHDEILKKMTSDLNKAIELRDEAVWEIEAWTFLSNYPIPEVIAKEIIIIGKKNNIDVSWRGADYFAKSIIKFKDAAEQFPNLIATDIQATLNIILDNLTKPGSKNPITQTPITQLEQERLLMEKPDYWSYLYFGSILVVGRKELEGKWLNHKFKFARPSGIGYSHDEALHQLRIIFPQLIKTIDGLANLVNENAPIAFGSNPQEGDEATIKFIATRILNSYEDMLDWASRLRSATYPNAYEGVILAAAHMVDEPLDGIRNFIDTVHTQGDRIYPYITGPHKDDDLEISMTLKLSVNAKHEKDFNREMKKFNRKQDIL